MDENNSNVGEKGRVEGDITVILNLYRRPEYLKEQIDAIRNQSIKPKEIWLWVNYHPDNEIFDLGSIEGIDRVIKSNYNWKFYGRFTAALMAQTEYIAMFDDDTIPGKDWFKNCLECMTHTPGIMGGAGVRLNTPNYITHTRVGWNAELPSDSIVEVDLVGHAWFFKQDWAKYQWYEQPYMYDNGEDIQFSYLCQKYGNIPTFCPPHPASKPEYWSSKKGWKYGTDVKASSQGSSVPIQTFYTQRDECIANARKHGWKTVNDLSLIRN